MVPIWLVAISGLWRRVNEEEGVKRVLIFPKDKYIKRNIGVIELGSFSVVAAGSSTTRVKLLHDLLLKNVFILFVL